MDIKTIPLKKPRTIEGGKYLKTQQEKKKKGAFIKMQVENVYAVVSA